MTRKFRDTKYCADETGRIFNSRTGKELRQQSNGRYNKVTLSIDGKQRQFLVHRIIAELFIPNPENKGEVNHINGIKTDNRVENLEWVTPQENQQHSVRIGLKPLGTELWNGKFTREQVMTIIEERKNGKTITELSAKYGVDETTISAISRGLRYKHYFDDLSSFEKPERCGVVVTVYYTDGTSKTFPSISSAARCFGLGRWHFEKDGHNDNLNIRWTVTRK